MTYFSDIEGERLADALRARLIPRYLMARSRAGCKAKCLKRLGRSHWRREILNRMSIWLSWKKQANGAQGPQR